MRLDIAYRRNVFPLIPYLFMVGAVASLLGITSFGFYLLASAFGEATQTPPFENTIPLIGGAILGVVTIGGGISLAYVCLVFASAFAKTD